VTLALADSGSFRDPSGQIFRKGDEIYRTVAARAAADYEFVRDSGLIQRLAARGLVVAASEVDRARLGPAAAGATYLLEHPLIRFVSYPYEWPFGALRTAALLHLDVQLESLGADVSLSDATAYNVQFIGPKAVFIDHLSFRRYRDGEIWSGHRQFCEQFLNPLLLRALLGIPHNAWFRGTQEGISTAEITRLIPLRRKISWNVLSNVVLPAALERSSRQTDAALESRAINRAMLPRASYRAMLLRLRKWIAGLEPADTGKTVWRDYAGSHSYSSDEVIAKKAFVGEMAANVKPALLWDFGCNTGDYSKVALESGANYAIGFDFDQGALDLAFERSKVESLAFLPLLMDAANPSPNQGWSESERKGLAARASADALLALAFVHHLAIGRNVPLARVTDWLVATAPVGVVEFVPKSDPMIQRMLRLRDDIFDDYSEEHFLAAVGRRARIVKSAVVSASGRRLVWYDRSGAR
jgi:ribosomal protein L11 methylase PrmA